VVVVVAVVVLVATVEGLSSIEVGTVVSSIWAVPFAIVLHLPCCLSFLLLDDGRPLVLSLWLSLLVVSGIECLLPWV